MFLSTRHCLGNGDILPSKQERLRQKGNRNKQRGLARERKVAGTSASFRSLVPQPDSSVGHPAGEHGGEGGREGGNCPHPLHQTTSHEDLLCRGFNGALHGCQDLRVGHRPAAHWTQVMVNWIRTSLGEKKLILLPQKALAGR